MQQSTPSPLDDLLERCILALETGDQAAVDGVLAAHPSHADELRHRLEQLKALGILHAPAPTAKIPERLGDFRLLRQLGRGGMGIVYLAEQSALQRQVALKLVHPEQLFFPGARERFRREILAVARLQHPGIVPILTGGEADGIPFYAMELAHGASLQELLQELAGGSPATLDGQALRAALHRAMAQKHDLGPISDAPVFAGAWVSVCCRMALQAATALQHAHDQGVLHRDVKPSNLLLTSDGHVRLIDFGLASARGEQRITRTGSALGSLPYMAPEQVRGAVDAIDARTDVYSLGVSLYELLTLTLPHGDGSGTTRERILSGAVEPPTRRNTQVHPDVEAICLLAMDVDPARRYPTAAAFADDLRAFLDHRSVRARRPSLALRARRWAARNPGRAAAVVSVFLLCVPAPLAFAAQQSQARAEVQAERDTANDARKEAERQRTLVQAERDTATAERREAERQRTLADEQRERAEQNLGHALAAVDQMLFRTAQARLADVPRTKQLRRNLLEDAVQFYERLLTSAAAATVSMGHTVRAQRARTQIRLAILKSDLGDLVPARSLLEESIATLQELATASASGGLRRELASAHQQLADVLGRLDLIDLQMAQQRTAVALWAEVVAAAPDPGRDRQELDEARLALAAGLSRQRLFDEAHRLVDEVEASAAEPPPGLPDEDLVVAWRLNYIRAAEQRGTSASLAGDTGRAMAAFEQALARVDELPATYRSRPEVATARLGVLELLGTMAHQRRQWDRATTWLDQATAELERLFAEEPEIPSRAARLADQLGTRASNRRQLGDAPGALQDHDRAIELLQRVLQTSAAELHHRRRLAVGFGERAGCHAMDGNFEAALRDLERSEQEFERLLAANPDDELSKANLAATLGNHAGVLAQADRLPEARGLVERAIEIARGRRGGEAERSLVELCGTAADLAMRAMDSEAGVRWMDEAWQRVNEWLAKQPDDLVRQATTAMIAGNRGTMYLQMRRHADARTCWEEALPLARKASAGPFGRHVLGILLLRLSDVATRDDDVETARRWFAAALQEVDAKQAQFTRYPPLAALFDRADFEDLLHQHRNGR
jgi:tetratricopeptide (TPR) repeat protein